MEEIKKISTNCTETASTAFIIIRANSYRQENNTRTVNRYWKYLWRNLGIRKYWLIMLRFVKVLQKKSETIDHMMKEDFKFNIIVTTCRLTRTWHVIIDNSNFSWYRCSQRWKIFTCSTVRITIKLRMINGYVVQMYSQLSRYSHSAIITDVFQRMIYFSNRI